MSETKAEYLIDEVSGEVAEEALLLLADQPLDPSPFFHSMTELKLMGVSVHALRMSKVTQRAVLKSGRFAMMDDSKTGEETIALMFGKPVEADDTMRFGACFFVVEVPAKR